MGKLKQVPLLSTVAENALRAATPYTFFLVLLALLCSISETGPDYERYMEWSSAVLSHDLHFLTVPGLPESPTGVPFRQWSAGPGLLIAPFNALVSPVGLAKTAGLVAGFVCATVFWSCFFAGLKELSDGRLALLGCLVAFLATPLGYYSMSVSSETYSLLPAGILFLHVVALGARKRASLLAIGVSTGMLLMIRSYLAAYAWPALGAALFDECRQGARRAARCLVLLGLPIALAILQVAVVDYWMTGTPLRSPYQFGDEQFQSLDWRCPHLWSVLGDTFHGLFPTHPFMGLGLLLVIALIAGSLHSRRYREAAVWLLATAAIGVNIYAQGCWYYWWLGFFGMRGLTLAAIPATAGFIRVQSLCSPGIPNSDRGRFGIAVLGVAGACALWSWLLLTEVPPGEYTEWGPMLSGVVAQIQQWLAPARMALLFFCGLAAALVLRESDSRLRPAGPTGWMTWVAATFVVACLLHRLFFLSNVLGLPYYGAVAAVTAAVVLGATFRPVLRVASLSTWVATLLLCSMVAFFVPFAVQTQGALYVHKGVRVILDEIHTMAACRRLATIPRMAAHRKHIVDFLRRQKGEAWYEQSTEFEMGPNPVWPGVEPGKGNVRDQGTPPRDVP